MINTVFFDVGGTLLQPDLDRLMAPLLKRAKPTSEQLAAADRASKYSIPVNADAAAPSRDNGSQPVNKGHWQVYFEDLLGALGCCHDLLPELVARAGDSSFWSVLDPETPKTLRELRQSYRLAVISNADGRIRELLERTQLAAYFEQIIDSGLAGSEKPDPQIFQAALKAMDAEAGSSLYVGDLYGIDYCGARRVGMKAVLLDPAGVYDGWPAPRIKSLTELPEWFEACRAAAG